MLRFEPVISFLLKIAIFFTFGRLLSWCTSLESPWSVDSKNNFFRIIRPFFRELIRNYDKGEHNGKNRESRFFDQIPDLDLFLILWHTRTLKMKSEDTIDTSMNFSFKWAYFCKILMLLIFVFLRNDPQNRVDFVDFWVKLNFAFRESSESVVRSFWKSKLDAINLKFTYLVPFFLLFPNMWMNFFYDE